MIVQLFIKTCCFKKINLSNRATNRFPLKEFVILIFILCILSNASACIIRGKKISTLPFEMVGTYMIVKVKINDSQPLNLILDSGVRNIIITELFPEDLIS